MMRLCHGKRITRGGRRVQLIAMGASTGAGEIRLQTSMVSHLPVWKRQTFTVERTT
jgi:hypothetical protein